MIVLLCAFYALAIAIVLVGVGFAAYARTGPQSTLAMAVIAIGALLLLAGAAFARDDGRYANSALKPWFDSLRSGKGPCCSDADGSAVSDADWQSSGGHYRVRVPMRPGGDDLQWVDVPEDAVITEPNRAGRTMVWPIYGYQGLTIRCFMPGSMT